MLNWDHPKNCWLIRCDFHLDTAMLPKFDKNSTKSHTVFFIDFEIAQNIAHQARYLHQPTMLVSWSDFHGRIRHCSQSNYKGNPERCQGLEGKIWHTATSEKQKYWNSINFYAAYRIWMSCFLCYFDRPTNLLLETWIHNGQVWKTHIIPNISYGIYRFDISNAVVNNGWHHVPHTEMFRAHKILENN